VPALVAVVDEVMSTRTHAGERVDFIDGVVFSDSECYLTLARWTDDLEGRVRPSDYTGDEIFYRSIQTRRRDVLTAHDYLWRWDTDWFWCSRAFGAQIPAVRRLWPRDLLRSDVYWRIVAFENRHRVMARIDRVRGQPARERVVQDVEIPLGRTADFVGWFLREVPIEPIWLCPIQLRSSGDGARDGARDGSSDDPPWPLYPLRRDERYVNVGFWSSVPIAPGAGDGDVNRAIEHQVTALGGHKSLYSDAYYDPATFARLYGDAAYRPVKRRYDPDGRFATLYEKAVQAQ
jgi:FAD/FMN-containing dehydrogenase